MKHKRISDLAASIGVSHTAIRRAINSGRIPQSLIGSKELASGRKITIILDGAAARAAYLAASPASRDDAQMPLSAPGDHDDHEDDDDDALPSISKSRRVVEAFKAKLTRLEYEQKSGKLVDAQEFLTMYTARVVAARTQLLGVPSKAKGRIPHLSIDDAEILTTLIRDALEAVADGWPKFDQWLESTRDNWLPLIADSSPTRKSNND